VLEHSVDGRERLASYAYGALAGVTADDLGHWFWLDIVIAGGSIVLALVIGALTLRRRTPWMRRGLRPSRDVHRSHSPALPGHVVNDGKDRTDRRSGW
jgi:hypothetical protein